MKECIGGKTRIQDLMSMTASMDVCAQVMLFYDTQGPRLQAVEAGYPRTVCEVNRPFRGLVGRGKEMM